jgi:hypothetical protein
MSTPPTAGMVQTLHETIRFTEEEEERSSMKYALAA